MNPLSHHNWPPGETLKELPLVVGLRGSTFISGMFRSQEGVSGTTVKTMEGNMPVQQSKQQHITGVKDNLRTLERLVFVHFLITHTVQIPLDVNVD